MKLILRLRFEFEAKTELRLNTMVGIVSEDIDSTHPHTAEIVFLEENSKGRLKYSVWLIQRQNQVEDMSGGGVGWMMTGWMTPF